MKSKDSEPIIIDVHLLPLQKDDLCYGRCVYELDPFHIDAFPSELKHAALRVSERKRMWMCEDCSKNLVGFCRYEVPTEKMLIASGFKVECGRPVFDDSGEAVREESL